MTNPLIEEVRNLIKDRLRDFAAGELRDPILWEDFFEEGVDMAEIEKQLDLCTVNVRFDEDHSF